MLPIRNKAWRETERGRRALLLLSSTMKMLDLHDIALKSEAACLEFLKSLGIFCDSAARCPGKHGFSCLKPMKTILRPNRKEFIVHARRFSKKSCRVQHSIWVTNRFFGFHDSRGRTTCNLLLQNIILIVNLFVYSNSSLDQFVIKTGHRTATICDWLNLCREVCSTVIGNQSKMVATNAKPVHIDESYFQGCRKYNRGRLWDRNMRADEEWQQK